MEFADVLLVGAAALLIVYKTTPNYRNDPNADPTNAAYASSEFEVTKRAITTPSSLTKDGAAPPMYGASRHVCSADQAGYVPLVPWSSSLPGYATNDATSTNMHRNIYRRGEFNYLNAPHNPSTLLDLYTMGEDEPVFNHYQLYDHVTSA